MPERPRALLQAIGTPKVSDLAGMRMAKAIPLALLVLGSPVLTALAKRLARAEPSLLEVLDRPDLRWDEFTMLAMKGQIHQLQSELRLLPLEAHLFGTATQGLSNALK